MKIGVITVHDSSNYGSFLQAYALMKVLQGMGHEVFFIRTRAPRYLKKLFVPGPKAFLKHPFKAAKAYINGSVKRRCFLNDQRCFTEIDSCDASQLDLIILGSDEIWNVKTPAFTSPIFYGVGMSSRAVTYGVSVGSATIEDFLIYPNLIDAIKKLDAIAVRDESTAKMVDKFTSKQALMVCDPTLLLEVQEFQKPYKNAYLDTNDYLVVYSYGVSATQKDVIISFARSRNLKIICPCFPVNWADQNIICGPLQFASVLSKASCIVTTTFHGTIFSVLAQKPFVSIPTSIKTRDVLNRLGLEQQIIEGDISVDKLASKLESQPIDYDLVQNSILALRESSLICLEELLKNP